MHNDIKINAQIVSEKSYYNKYFLSCICILLLLDVIVENKMRSGLGTNNTHKCVHFQ